jgi:hypothetical protein
LVIFTFSNRGPFKVAVSFTVTAWIWNVTIYTTVPVHILLSLERMPGWLGVKYLGS